jgi:hypothetical protein
MINGEDSMLASVLAMFLTRKLDAYGPLVRPPLSIPSSALRRTPSPKMEKGNGIYLFGEGKEQNAFILFPLHNMERDAHDLRSGQGEAGRDEADAPTGPTHNSPLKIKQAVVIIPPYFLFYI